MNYREYYKQLALFAVREAALPLYDEPKKCKAIINAYIKEIFNNDRLEKKLLDKDK